MPGHKSKLSLTGDPPANRRLRQKACQFEANLAYKVKPCFKSNPLEAGEMAQWIRCSPYKHEGPSSIPTTHIKKPGTVAYLCNHSPVEAKTEGPLRLTDQQLYQICEHQAL